MDFKPYLENILKDEEFTKWQNLYVPLKAEDVIEELPTMSVIEEMIFKKASIEDREILQNRLKRNKYEFESQDIITEIIEGKNKRVILVGESGSGKTTLLKWITLRYAEQSIREITKIPVYVDLGAYHKKIEAEGFLFSILNSMGLESSFEELISAFESGKFLFLFDGLDLLSTNIEKFDPFTSIQKFISKYPKNSYFLSCRKGIRHITFSPNYKVIELLELTDDKIEKYLAHYVKDANKREEILTQIHQVPQFKEACRTPLILLLIIAIFTRYKEIPANRTRVYYQYINCLYDLFEKIGKIGKVEKEIINDVLCELGLKLQITDETVISKEQILTIIANFIIKHKYEKMAKDEILKLCSQLGFLKVEGEDVKFFYQSFREYFASLKLKELFLSGIDISCTFTHPKWEDILIFLTSNLESQDASKLVQTIMKTPYEFNNPLFIAAKCIIGSMVNAETKQEIIKQLVTNVSDKYWYNQREAIYALTRILGEEVESVSIEPLIQKLKDEEWTRREKSAKAMGRMCDKGAVSHLKRLLEDESPAVYNAAFEAIIEIERKEKEKMKIEFKTIPFPIEMPEEGFPVEEIIKHEEVKEEVEEQRIIPIDGMTAVYINLSRSGESIGIQMEETKLTITEQLFESTLKPIIENEHGKVEDMIEGFTTAIFENPREALYSTVKMQGAIDEYNLRQPSRKVDLRLSVYTGRHNESRERMKNLAAKICELTRPAQILVVENTYKAVHGKDKTVRFRYFGSRKLEGEESQKRGIYELLWQGEGHASMIKESIMAVEYLDHVSLFNMTKNKPVIDKIKIVRSFWARLKGLMFAKESQPLLMEFSESSGTKLPIHTFFVQFPIDIICLDSNFKVVDLIENLLPFKLYIPQTQTKYILECPEGTIKKTEIELSDIVIFKE